MSLYEYLVVIEDEQDRERYLEGIRLIRSEGWNRDYIPGGYEIHAELAKTYRLHDYDTSVCMGRPLSGEGVWFWDGVKEFDYGEVYVLDESLGGRMLCAAREEGNKEAETWLIKNAGRHCVLVNDNEWG